MRNIKVKQEVTLCVTFAKSLKATEVADGQKMPEEY